LESETPRDLPAVARHNKCAKALYMETR